MQHQARSGYQTQVDNMDEFLQKKARELGATETGKGWAKFPSMGQAIGFATRFVFNPKFEGTIVRW
jgi:hypothetical protein